MHSYKRDTKRSRRSGQDTEHQNSSEVERVQKAGVARDSFVDRVLHEQETQSRQVWGPPTCEAHEERDGMR